MIKYDYTITRDEGNESKIYSPNLSKELHDLIYIEGPNSSGKSTLLNILSIAFYGLNDDRLNISLKNKLKNLVDTSYQKLTFNISVNNNGTKVISKKDNPDTLDICVQEIVNNKTINMSQERFSQKYKLIYDIPDNPTDRLRLLLYDILKIQTNVANKLGAFRKKILDVIKDINESKDPVKIQEFQDLIKKEQNDIARLNEELSPLNQTYTYLEKYYGCKYLSEYKILRKALNKDLREHVEKRRHVKRSTKQISSDLEQLKVKKENAIEELQELHNELTNNLKRILPPKKQMSLNVWENINIDHELYHGHDNIEKEVSKYLLFLDQMMKKEDPEATQEIKLLEEIITFFSSYTESKILLPGVERTIPEFLEIINKKLKNYKTLQIKLDLITMTKNNLNMILENKNNTLENIINKIKIIESKQGDIIDEIDDSINSYTFKEKENKLNNKLAKTEAKISKLSIICDKYEILDKDIPFALENMEKASIIKAYRLYSEEQLKDSLDDLKTSINSKTSETVKKKSHLDFLEKEVAKLNSMSAHKYQDKKRVLSSILALSQNVEQRFNRNYYKYIDELISNKVDQTNMNDDQTNYYKNVFKFLADKVEYVRHVDKDHKVDSIDMLKREILTAENKIIKLDDLGTGQGQSAYLMGLLNSDDDRKLIVMFDEIAMMDKKSLEPIYNKLKELYNNNKLLFAILVQKSDTPNVTEIY